MKGSRLSGACNLRVPGMVQHYQKMTEASRYLNLQFRHWTSDFALQTSLINGINSVSCLSKIKFSPPSRRGHREEVFLFGGEIPPNKKPSVPFRTRFLIGAIAIKRFRSQSRREEAFDPTPRFAGLDQKKICLCDLRTSALNLILRGVNVNRKVQ